MFFSKIAWRCANAAAHVQHIALSADVAKLDERFGSLDASDMLCQAHLSSKIEKAGLMICSFRLTAIHINTHDHLAVPKSPPFGSLSGPLFYIFH